MIINIAPKVLMSAFVLYSSHAFSAGGSSYHKYRFFNHDVIFQNKNYEPTELSVDGKVLIKNDQVGMTEVGVTAGTPFMIGYSGNGGASCDAPPFIVSFPTDKPVRIDGPIFEGCGSADIKTAGDKVVFSVPAGPNSDGETWTWTPNDGLRSNGKTKFVPNPESGWNALRSREFKHPGDVFDYKDLSAAADEILLTQKSNFMKTLGPGSVEYSGDWLIGSSCVPHNCPGGGSGGGSLTIIGIQERKMFFAWRLPDKPFTIRPAAKDWPERVRRELNKWMKTFQ